MALCVCVHHFSFASLELFSFFLAKGISSPSSATRNILTKLKIQSTNTDCTAPVHSTRSLSLSFPPIRVCLVVCLVGLDETFLQHRFFSGVLVVLHCVVNFQIIFRSFCSCFACFFFPCISLSNPKMTLSAFNCLQSFISYTKLHTYRTYASA